jgi:2-polyprenyl-6-methoxyphenol hydroxylase-like FAD-dependent oxidoreductase
MSNPLNNRIDVLIVGAGPTGLVLALWLKRLGIDVRVIDKTAEAGTTSRALAISARTLEFYQHRHRRRREPRLEALLRLAR